MLQESIKTGLGNFFVYVEMPKALQARYATLSRALGGSGEVDHITILYVPSSSSITPELTQKALASIAMVCKSHGPMRARVQGWAYFDGAKAGMTALVALLDVPGLTDVFVDVKRAAIAAGISVSDKHGFMPHATFAYVPRGTKSPGPRPVFDDEFVIHELCVATDHITHVSLGTGLTVVEHLKTNISGVVGKLNEELWDQSYKDDTNEADLMLDKDSVYVSHKTKHTLKKWLASMGLLGRSGVRRV